MPEYKPYLIAFFDILGFKNELAEKTCDEIHRVFEVFEEDNKFTKTLGEEPEMLYFSDSVIRFSVFEKYKDCLDTLVFCEIMSLIHLQSLLIDKGVLVRGALTWGDLYVEGSMIYGDGVVKAYELESNVAIYPRIIIDPEIIELINRYFEGVDWAEQQLRDYRKVLCLSDAGYYYLNYLRAIENEFDDPDYYPIFLAKHRDLIKQKQKEDMPARDKSKIIWLVNYHNRIVNEISEEYFKAYNQKKESFLIGTELNYIKEQP
jgi:hypothetical protein